MSFFDHQVALNQEFQAWDISDFLKNYSISPIKKRVIDTYKRTMKLIIPQKVSEIIESLHGEREAPTCPRK